MKKFQTKNKISNLAKLMLCVVSYFTLFSCEKFEGKEYTVEIIYCDNRPSKTIKITSTEKPANWQIDTYKLAVPEWRDELNVCELRVVE